MRFAQKFKTLTLPALSLLLCLAPGVATAQTPGSSLNGSESREFQPFVGVVVQDNAELRAGGGSAYYVVGHLDRGTRVQVVDNHFGWYRIVAPTSIHSQIAKDKVQRMEGAGQAMVIDEPAQVRTENLSDPGDSWRVQLTLNDGDKVTIVGDWGDSYRIEPPASAHVYISPSLIRRAGDQTAIARVEAEEAVAEATPMVETIEPAPPAIVRVTPTHEAVTPTPATAEVEPDPVNLVVIEESGAAEAGVESGDEEAREDEGVMGIERGDGVATEFQPDSGGGTSVPPVGSNSIRINPDEPTTAEPAFAVKADPKPAEVAAATDATLPTDLAEAEAKYGPSFEQPLEEQPLEEMLAAYERLEKIPSWDEESANLIAARLAAIERNLRLRAALTDLDEVRGRVESAREKEGSDRVDVPATQPTDDETQAAEAGPIRYNAVGRLLASGVYNGRSRPKLYRLVDPSLNRTVAYIAPMPGGDLDALEGQLVGVVGAASYDPGLKLQVISPTRADPLASDR